MNKKHGIIAVIVISLIFCGCAPSYRFLKMKDADSGYLVKRGKTEQFIEEDYQREGKFKKPLA